MNFSSNVLDRRATEQKVLRSHFLFSSISSLVLHILVLTLISLWLRTPKFVEQPIDVIVVDPPSLKAAKPKPKGKIAPIVNARKSDTHQSLKTIALPGASSVSKKGQMTNTNSAPSSQSITSQLAIAQPLPVVVAKKLSQPTEEATKQKPIAKKQPQLVATPKLLSTPIAPLSPQSVKTLNLAQTLPSSASTSLPASLNTSSPRNVATLPPKLVEAPKPLASPIATLTPKQAQAQTPKRVSVPTPSLSATSKPTSTSHFSIPIPPSQPQDIAGSITHQSDTPDEGGNRQKVAMSSTNRESRDSGGDTGNGNLGQSNGFGNTLGTSSGSGSKVSTGIGNGNGSSIGLGSNGVICRRCPAPEYPLGAENLEGRAVVVINIEKDGNVSNVEIVKSTGYDNLDQTVLETIKKKWKFASSQKEQRVRAAVNFALAGSDFYHQARTREHQARELKHQGIRERLFNP